MKIVKQPAMYNTKYKSKEQMVANIGCEVCPCCGSKDMRSFTYNYHGLFKHGHIDRHTCKNCKAVWESELYKPY